MQSIFFLITAWIWAFFSAAIVCGLVIAAFSTFDDDEPYQMAFILLGAVGGTGLLFASLTFLGEPVAAIWAWRIFAGVVCAYGLLAIVKAIIEGSNVPEVLSIVGGTILVGAVLTTGILTTSGPFTSPPVTAPSALILRMFAPQIDVWHTFALAMLALTTMTFFLLYLIDMRRGIPPAVESQWGGLGGGITGWQISSSLSYLIGVIVCAVLFSVFLLHEENSAVFRVPVTSAKEAASQPFLKPEPKSVNDIGVSVSVSPQSSSSLSVTK